MEETNLLERLVEVLRLLALAEANQLRIEMKSVKLEELAETTLGLFSAQAAEKNQPELESRAKLARGNGRLTAFPTGDGELER